MADAGPPERPPFNDPHDPRWYSDPGRRGARSAETGSHAADSAEPAGSGPPPGYGTQSYPQPPYPQQQYPRQYGAFAPAEPRGLSITALALGAAAVFTGGLLLIPQILAVVFGHLALRREPAGRPLALTGLIMGYVMLFASAIVLIVFIGLIAMSTAAPIPGGP